MAPAQPAASVGEGKGQEQLDAELEEAEEGHGQKQEVSGDHQDDQWRQVVLCLERDKDIVEQAKA